ncbi:MAG: FtsX-like permease family protein [Planctomycetota bacterium]|nr:FtsX-like permease family protein [Planctomycetota bacterium]
MRRTLDKKLLRNLLTMRAQIIAIVLIIACGVASLVTMLTSYSGLTTSRDAYYARYRMADVFAPVKRAPRSVLYDVERIPGIREVQGRIVFDVTIDIPWIAQPCSGRTSSVPDRPGRILCGLHMTAGSWFEGDGTRQVILADRFAREHRLKVGDDLLVLMNNKKQPLRIVGIAQSPEHVYLIRGAGDIIPDHERFTVMWLSESFSESVFGYEEAINDILATVERSANVQEVIASIDQRLEEYGAIGAYALKDQASNRYLNDEIEGMEASAGVVPIVFLGIAAFVLNVLMGRLVRSQRGQVAIFRAFGYSNAQVVAHYLKLALLVGLLGAIVGSALGLWFASAIGALYKEFFDLPFYVFQIDTNAIAGGLFVSVGFATLGALQAVRAVARLDPAEGLRPAAPSTYGRTLFERVRPLWRRMGFASRMVLRHVARTPARAAMAAVGIAFATAIVLFTSYIYDAWDAMVDTQFRLIERQDARVVFHEKRGREALYEVRHEPGVLAAEPELVVAVELANGPRTRRTGILGLPRDTELHGLLDRSMRRVALPEDGLMLSQALADVLGVVRGDTLEVRVLEGERPVLSLPVTAVLDEYLGAFAYADIELLSRWLDESYVMSSVRLRVDPHYEDELGTALKDLPAVAAVTFKDRTVKAFRDTAEESQQLSNAVLLFFAGVIAFGVLYNTARISLAERARELGTMRVIGCTQREVGLVLAGESAVLTVLGLIPGIAFGIWLSWVLSKAYATELYRFPFVMHPSNVVTSVCAIVVFAVIANALVLRRLRKSNVIEVLKTRE